jgi:hypothetical protein
MRSRIRSGTLLVTLLCSAVLAPGPGVEADGVAGSSTTPNATFLQQ